MAKREIPLFVIDTTRSHKLGECDFIVCTDMDNGFVASIDYIPGQKEEVTDTVRISPANNHVSAKMEIKRFTGQNPNPSQIRTLMKKGMEKYVSENQRVINVENPSVEDMVSFLDTLIKGNKHQINECSLKERDVVLMSISMLEHIKQELEE